MKKLFTLAAVAAFSIHSYAQDVADNADFSDENPLAVQADASRKNLAAWPAFFAIGDLPETPDLVGLRITIPWSTKQESVTGFDVGLWARTQFFEGFAFNVFRNDVKDELTDSAPKLNILRDVVIRLTGQRTCVWYPETLRLIEAIVEVDGKPKHMTFITDNFTWAAGSICDLYKARWAIEVFFKEIKQTLQLSDFIGYNENAVRWQIWTALLTYVLLRFIAWQNEWKHTFTRLFTALRGVIWRCLDMGSVLKCCGTASDPVRMRGVAIRHLSQDIALSFINRINGFT